MIITPKLGYYKIFYLIIEVSLKILKRRRAKKDITYNDYFEKIIFSSNSPLIQDALATLVHMRSKLTATEVIKDFLCMILYITHFPL